MSATSERIIAEPELPGFAIARLKAVVLITKGLKPNRAIPRSSTGADFGQILMFTAYIVMFSYMKGIWPRSTPVLSFFIFSSVVCKCWNKFGETFILLKYMYFSNRTLVLEKMCAGAIVC
jgi:hypothetical protein